MIELIMVSGAYIIDIIIGIIICKIYIFFHLKYIDDNTYMYEYDEKDKIIHFEYKNNKDMKLQVIKKCINNKEDIYHIIEKEFIINDKKVAFLYSIENNFFKKRYIHFNYKYDTVEFYKILRKCRKQYNKNLVNEIREKHNNEDKKIY